MRQLNGIYTQRFNKRHGRVGHLFQGRFKAVLVQKDSHLLEACRYVVLSPVRAKRVQIYFPGPPLGLLASTAFPTQRPSLSYAIS